MLKNKPAPDDNMTGPNPNRRILVERMLDNGRVVKEYISGRKQNILGLLGEIKGTILNCSFRNRDCSEDEKDNEARRER